VAVTSAISLDVGALGNTNPAALLATLSSAATGGDTSQDENVAVVLEQIASLVTTVPAGVSAAQMRGALEGDLCANAAAGTCSVADSSSSLGRRLLAARRLQSVSFEVTQTIDPTSTAPIVAPTVNTAAVAGALGVSPSDVPAPAVTATVAATITVIAEGSATDSAADSAVSNLGTSAITSAVATGLGISANAIAVSAPRLITPPAPPPKPPPLSPASSQPGFGILNPADFQHTMTLTLRVFLDGVPQTGGTIASFTMVTNELRGVESTPTAPPFGPFAGIFQWGLTTYEDVAGTAHTFSFQPNGGQITNCATEYAFVVDGNIGGVTNPLEVRCGSSQSSLSISLAAGWNEISFNIVPPSMAVSDLFSTSTHLQTSTGALTGDNQIKDQRSFTSFYPDYAVWYGSLSMLTTTTMYKVYFTQAATLAISGAPIDVAAVQTTLTPGWNYLPCPWPAAVQVQSGCTSNGCVDPLPLGAYTSGDQVKDKTSFITFYDGFGWYTSSASGFLLQPGRGYMLSKGGAATETVGWGTPTAMGRRQLAKGTGTSSSVGGSSNNEWIDSVYTNHASWGLRPGKYEASMTLTAAVHVRGELQQAGILLAYVDNEVRGIGKAATAPTPIGPFAGSFLFDMLVHVSSADVAQVLSFNFVPSVVDDGSITLPLQGTVVVVSEDKAVGNLLAPMNLRYSDADGVEMSVEDL